MNENRKTLEPNLASYLRVVHRDHHTRLARRGFSLYAWFWFHTQFWLPPVERRPYTFIMRDWLYTHLRIFGLLVIAWYAGVFLLVGRHPYLALALGIFSSLLLAHLCWGSQWQKGEQEWPPFLGGKGPYLPGYAAEAWECPGFHKGQPCIAQPGTICQENACSECWLWADREDK